MPSTGSDPSFRRIDVSTDTGRVMGLFLSRDCSRSMVEYE